MAARPSACRVPIRALLVEKARAFQIVVFTCRPDDYLVAAAMVTGDGPAYVTLRTWRAS